MTTQPQKPETGSSNCPSCGNPAQGKFCSSCGAVLGGKCRSCGASLPSGGRFCHECGTPTARATSTTSTRPWILGGGIAVVAVLAIAVWNTTGRRPEVAPPASPGFGAATTDISQMTPREQADRLFDRVMRAQEAGDGGEVSFFTPMAVQAYGLLGTLDADARYHVGLLHAATGATAITLAYADSLELETPGHLFASMLRATVAMAADDAGALDAAYDSFLTSYPAETVAARAEYAAHTTSIESFATEARNATGDAR